MQHAAIPTTYKGIRFRSRLEAKYAALFDLKGDTRWEYEPVDLPGYIPDFALHVLDGNPTPFLAEVKPIYTIEQFLNSRDCGKMFAAFERAPEIFEGFIALFLLGNTPRHWWVWTRDTLVWTPVPPNPRAIEAWKYVSNSLQWKGPV